MSVKLIPFPKNSAGYNLWLPWADLLARYEWLAKYDEFRLVKSYTAISMHHRLINICSDIEAYLNLHELDAKEWCFDSVRLEALSLAANIENRYLAEDIDLLNAISILEHYKNLVMAQQYAKRHLLYPIIRGEHEADTLIPLAELHERYPLLRNYLRRASNTPDDLTRFTAACSNIARSSCVQAPFQKARDDDINHYDELNTELYGIITVLTYLIQTQEIPADNALSFFRLWSDSTRNYVRKCKGLPEQRKNRFDLDLYPLRNIQKEASEEPPEHEEPPPPPEDKKPAIAAAQVYKKKKKQKKTQGADFVEDDEGGFKTREEIVDSVLANISRSQNELPEPQEELAASEEEPKRRKTRKKAPKAPKRSTFDYDEEDPPQPPKRIRRVKEGPKRPVGRPKGVSPRSEVQLLKAANARLHPSAGSTSEESSQPAPEAAAPKSQANSAPVTPEHSEKKKSDEPPDPAAHDISIIFEKD